MNRFVALKGNAVKHFTTWITHVSEDYTCTQQLGIDPLIVFPALPGKPTAPRASPCYSWIPAYAGKTKELQMTANDVFLQRPPRQAFSLLELMAVVMILGILAALIMTRFIEPSNAAKRNACYVYKGEIELQAQLWYRHKNSWPANDLSDIGADGAYFPEGPPICPVDGTAYTFDPVTQRVIGHTH